MCRSERRARKASLDARPDGECHRRSGPRESHRTIETDRHLGVATMGALSPTHWAIIIVLVLLLFGSRKLPDMARGMGQSLRIFKAEPQELRNEGTKSEEQSAQAPAVEKGPATAQTVEATSTSTST